MTEAAQPASLDVQPAGRTTDAEGLEPTERRRLADGRAHLLASRANRTAQPLPPGGPWLLSSLLAPTAHTDTPLPALDDQTSMVAQAERLLAEGPERWTMVRRLVAECDSLPLLHYLCSSPALFGPDHLAARLLARGSHRHVSCGLYALHLAPGRAPEVTSALLAELDTQPLELAAPRLLDLYAQTWLDRGEPEVLRAALLRWLADRLSSEDAESTRWRLALRQARASDSRLLRQVFLFADLADLLRASNQRWQAAQLHEELLRSFFASFTPAGSQHPLADATWRARLGDGLAEALELRPELAAGLEVFGQGLPALAARWTAPPRRGGEDGASQALASQFLRLYGGTLVQAARALWRRHPSSPVAAQCYALLGRVLLAHRRLAAGGGAFGALEHLLPPETGVAETSFPLAGLEQAARIEQRALENPRQTTRRVRWLPSSLRDELRASTVSQPFMQAVGGELWDGTPVWADQTSSVPSRGLLPTLLGLDALRLAARLPLRLLGHQPLGELAIDGNHLVLRHAQRLLGVVFARRELRLPLEGLRTEPLPVTPRPLLRVAGWLVLTLGTVLGTVLLYTGLEQPGGTLEAAQGLGMILAALLYEAACHHRHLESRDEALLKLMPVGQRTSFTVRVGRGDRELLLGRLGGR